MHVNCCKVDRPDALTEQVIIMCVYYYEGENTAVLLLKNTVNSLRKGYVENSLLSINDYQLL